MALVRQGEVPRGEGSHARRQSGTSGHQRPQHRQRGLHQSGGRPQQRLLPGEPALHRRGPGHALLHQDQPAGERPERAQTDQRPQSPGERRQRDGVAVHHGGERQDSALRRRGDAARSAGAARALRDHPGRGEGPDPGAGSAEGPVPRLGAGAAASARRRGGGPAVDRGGEEAAT